MKPATFLEKLDLYAFVLLGLVVLIPLFIVTMILALPALAVSALGKWYVKRGATQFNLWPDEYSQ